MPEFQSETSLGRLARWITGKARPDFKQFAREALTLTAVVLVVILLEMLGRWHTSEFLDLATVLTFVLTVAMVVSWHKRLQLHWTRRLWRLVKHSARRLRGLRFQWGLDLRREPLVPRAVPPALSMAPIALSVAIALAVVWAVIIGAPARDYIAGVSYVIYVALTASLWAGLLCVLLTSAFLPAWIIFDVIKAHLVHWRRHARRIGWSITIVYFVLLLAAALTLPIWVAAVVLLVTVALAAALPWLLRTWYPDCVWRAKGDGQVRSLSLGTLFSLQLTTVALVPLALVLLALGPELLGFPEGYVEAPISTSLGRVTAWLAGGGLLVFLGLLATHMGISRWHDPARPAPTCVHVDGLLDQFGQKQVRQQLESQGWQVAFVPTSAQRSDVKIAVGEADQPAVDGEAIFHFTLEQLDDDESIQRIARRDVIQRRRHLLRGLRSIFRTAAARKDRSGSGYWVAPHFWFVDGLTRDEFDDEDTNMLDVIPPLYYKILPRPARGTF